MEKIRLESVLQLLFAGLNGVFDKFDTLSTFFGAVMISEGHKPHLSLNRQNVMFSNNMFEMLSDVKPLIQLIGLSVAGNMQNIGL